MNFPTLRFPFFPGILALMACSGRLWADDPAAAGPSPAPVAALAEALPGLKSNYIDFDALQVKPGDQLADVIGRSEGKMELEPAAKEEVSPAPILDALLPGQIVYYRLASFVPARGWADFSAQLDKWLGQNVAGVVLDVRSNETPNDFEGAARLADYFTPPGATLFSLQDSHGNSHPYVSPKSGAGPDLFSTPLVVLTDGETAGAAEALAACLKSQGALVIGGVTKGRGAVFADQKLPSGQTLHYVMGRVIMPDNQPLWGHPVLPDIGVTVNKERQKADLALIGQNRVLDLIREAADRHRLSEAALVRGEDPEIQPDAEGGKAAEASLAQDVVLVDALDSLKAIEISQARPGSTPGEAVASRIPTTVQ